LHCGEILGRVDDGGRKGVDGDLEQQVTFRGLFDVKIGCQKHQAGLGRDGKKKQQRNDVI
jgi:hypothetical protein